MSIWIFLGLINVLLRTSGKHPFDKITDTATRLADRTPPQWEKSGGFDAAMKDFARLPGKAKHVSEGDKIVLVKDMGEHGVAVVRNTSSEGVPTLELQKPGGSSKTKAIRYED
jgi:hypothetical protein